MDSILDFFLPETASAPARARTRYTVAGALAGLVAVCSVALFHFGFAPAPVLLGAILGLIWLACEFVCLLRALDELQQRIHLMALACAGGVMAVSFTSWALAGLIWSVPTLSIAVGMPAFLGLYYIALAILRRRYASD